MLQYHDLLKDIIANGRVKEQRAVLASTGERPKITSLFGRQIRFDLTKGFPLVTTKKMPIKAWIHELLWFISGDTNVRYLQENKVTIWDEWADEAGDLGSVYGKHWRNWEGPQGKVDQLLKLVADIKKVRDNPNASEGRRLLLTSWNPADMPPSRVPSGCHTLFQFYVDGDRLSCQLYQRSADVFLGVPFNIASYALLTHLIAKVTGLVAYEFVHTFGDVHIYDNHMQQVLEQLERDPAKYALPALVLSGDFTDITKIQASQIELRDYQSFPALRGEVAI